LQHPLYCWWAYHEAQIQHGLSETGATGIKGAPPGPGPSVHSHGGGGPGAPGSGAGSFFNPSQMGSKLTMAAGAWMGDKALYALGFNPGVEISADGWTWTLSADAAPVPYLEIAAAIFGIVELFEDLFSGPSTPPTPRELKHGRNDLYAYVNNISTDYMPDEANSAHITVVVDLPNGDPPQAPLQKPEYRKAPAQGSWWSKLGKFAGCVGLAAVARPEPFVGFGAGAYACAQLNPEGCWQAAVNFPVVAAAATACTAFAFGAGSK
jgi:hypothetical protein